MDAYRGQPKGNGSYRMLHRQVLKGEDPVAKQAIQRVLELSSQQRKEMKSLQAALQQQLEEARAREEKQQATIKYVKTEMERKTKVIKDLQQEVSASVNVAPLSAVVQYGLLPSLRTLVTPEGRPLAAVTQGCSRAAGDTELRDARRAGGLI
ncbi:unnamed protein product [Arctogadus glacialis]